MSQNNQNSSDGQSYVNFDQFLNVYNNIAVAQNIAQNNYDISSNTMNDYSQSFYGNEEFSNRQQNPISNSNNQLFQNIQVENSTLLPTAAEFIPRCYESKSNGTYRDRNISQNHLHKGSDHKKEHINCLINEDQCKPVHTSNNDKGAVKKFSNNHNRQNRGGGYGSGEGRHSDDYHPRNTYSRNQNARYDNGNGNESNSYSHRNQNRYQDNCQRYNRNNDDYSRYQNDRSFRSWSTNDRNQHYNSNNKNDSFSSDSQSKLIKQKEKHTQRDNLSHEIDTGKLECLVCCENIKPYQSIWSCCNCFHIIHLNCTIKWATSSKSDDGWRCPACQNVSKNIPRDYFCFCGKTKNPQHNYNDLAHSCGELCERKEGCQHCCTQLCHPGACPPCQATVTRLCGCGKSSRIMQCNQKDEIKCNEICEKVLNCQIHVCKEKCHGNECAECQDKIMHNCYCGKENEQVPCTSENLKQLKYSCAKVCNRLLACSNHRCERICHPDNCGECMLSIHLITTCPCGKSPVVKGQRTSCSDPVPLCNAMCKKQLFCGTKTSPHFCSSRCHQGGCPPCNKETAVKCRCGNTDQMIKCRDLDLRGNDARCKKRCTKKRNCGKHKCNSECCIDIDHLCPILCNYSLSCGKHKCDKTCHKGRCAPCYRTSFEELYCECGVNVIYPPVPCGTKRPNCDQPCSRQHDCDHPTQHNCHSATNCPPCMILTTKLCYGKHEQRKTIPCSQDAFSCGLACNKPLKCGQHNCIKVCHKDSCVVEGEICVQNCTKTRSSCVHKCNAPCHTGVCPETACKETVEVICQCGHRKQNRSCHDFAHDYRRIATANLASSMQEMQRGHSIELSDILGPLKINNNKTLECNEDCRLQERNRRLAIGLQIRNPDVASKLQPKYSEFLRGWAKKDSQFIKSVHNKLTELVKLAKDSKQRSRSHSFPSMNREKRQVIHEMCSMFGVESVAYDAEPNRNVVATASKDKSWLPSMGILEVLQREVGQRRIPVPVNAWGLKK